MVKGDMTIDEIHFKPVNRTKEEIQANITELMRCFAQKSEDLEVSLFEMEKAIQGLKRTVALLKVDVVKHQTKKKLGRFF